MSNNKFNQFLGKCAKNEKLKSEFLKDPEKVLKDNGLNPDDIPSDVAEKISAAGNWDDFGQALLGQLTSMGIDLAAKAAEGAIEREFGKD